MPSSSALLVGLLAFVALVAAFASPVSALYIVVDAHAEECFHDHIERGSKLTVAFQVYEGGFLDIDIKITGPDGKIVYSGDRETDAKYTFGASETGRYTYCFGNKMSSLTPKILMFTVDIHTPEKPKPAGTEEHTDMLDSMVAQLHDHLTTVRRDQDYMEVREATHRGTNDSTNSRVLWWSFFEAIILVTMAVAQVFYLKRLFEVKRVV
ncbi:transmembrane emp24 domain-containing protein [Capsaspora owczarzaki ATCC 30864]|uniref:Transmembrane emp24 domain-containing protein n=1 Tax=Capsaspora owczarzaki (strain ATCC 30864) TaxID=595528 RepID=A0A0D2VVI5_CAPO3|nr:transmembrane emp24 domain-containing protein [Capsaspora owczarzaki ATCC 30864]KJE95497.1 transmembrane emp24 domain-containing protein [Capsaspora owczarzaki ATCC 30864]|eukprot:XP_004345536.1 transmembrane emp24 domain-containing protein [Capsaspora owczarzaki ATCC 30864]